ncbi:MAG TPA: hypothetical protein VGA66_15705, partial [Mycobacterium sp.]
NPAMLPVRPPSTPAAARKAASHHVIARSRYVAVCAVAPAAAWCAELRRQNRLCVAFASV